MSSSFICYTIGFKLGMATFILQVPFIKVGEYLLTYFSRLLCYKSIEIKYEIIFFFCSLEFN